MNNIFATKKAKELLKDYNVEDVAWEIRMNGEYKEFAGYQDDMCDTNIRLKSEDEDVEEYELVEGE